MTKEEILAMSGAELRAMAAPKDINESCDGCKSCTYCKSCKSCTDCTYCTDCKYCMSCTDCYKCHGLRGVRFAIANVQMTEDEYRAAMDKVRKEGTRS